VSTIAFDSQDNQVVYVGTSGAGVYKSEDGGKNWEMRNYGLGDPTVYSIVTDPQKSDTLFVGCDIGIYRSYDGADTLSEVHWFHRAFLAIDPQNSQLVYAGGKWNEFFKSEDGGEGWFRSGEGLPPGPPEYSIQWVLIDPSNPRILYAGSNNTGVYKSTNAALDWNPAKTGLGTNDVRMIGLDFSNPDLLYAATDKGVFRSTDGAETWQQMNEGLTNVDVKALAVDPLHPHILYAGTWGEGVFVRKIQ
jgi:photosystem II stability/assembly factor-like uncharacterized protein